MDKEKKQNIKQSLLGEDNEKPKKVSKKKAKEKKVEEKIEEVEANVKQRKEEEKEGRELKNMDNYAQMRSILREELIVKEISERERAIPCIMNFRKVYDDSQTYEIFTCLSCPGKPENICYICISLCHKGHKTSVSMKVYLKDVKCSCSKNNHKVQQTKSNYAQIDESMKHIECNLNDILYRSNSAFYYLDPKSHVYYCIYCLNYCMEVLPVNSFEENVVIEGVKYNLIEHSLKDYVKREKVKFIQGPPACQCKKIDHHDSIERNTYCVIEMLDNVFYDKLFNRIQLPSQIILTPALNEKFVKPIINFHTEVIRVLNDIEEKSKFLQENNNENNNIDQLNSNNNNINNNAESANSELNTEKKESLLNIKDKSRIFKSYEKFAQLYQNKELDTIYSSCIELIKSFERVFNIDYFYISNPQLQACFDIDFLLRILDVPEVKNDNFFIVKVNSVMFFRKFYLLPKLKYPNWKNFANFENVSPLHRIFFRRTFEEMVNLIAVSSDKYMLLMEKIYSSICSADYYVKEEELISMVVEFLELLLLTITCKFEKNEGMIYHFTQRLHNIMNIIYLKVEFEALMKNYMEKVVLYIILLNNDQLFLNFIMANDDDEDKQAEDAEVPEQDAQGVVNHSKRLLKFLGGVYSDLKVKMKLEEQKVLSTEEIEAVEEDRIRKLQKESLPFTNDSKYSFETGHFQTILLKTLFAYRKGKEIANYLESCYIYDILCNKEDFYSESVKQIAKCKKKLFTKDLIDLIDNFPKYFSTNSDHNNNTSNLFSNLANQANPNEIVVNTKLRQFFNIEHLTRIREEFFKLESYKKNFYDGIYKGEVYYSMVIQCLEIIVELLSERSFKNSDALLEYESNMKINIKAFKEEISKITTLVKPNVNMGNFELKDTNNTLSSKEAGFMQSYSENQEKLFEKQLILYKLNCFDTLINVAASFSANNYFKIFMREKAEKIMEKIIEILCDYLLFDNPFLMAIFYNTEPLTFLFEVSTSKLLKFYNDSLKVMIKYNYQINPEPLLTKIASKYDLTKWDLNLTDSRNILRIFISALSIANDKSMGHANNKVSFQVRNIISTDCFRNTLGNYILDLQALSSNTADLRLGEKKKTSREETDDFLYLIFRCIGNLQENYFYMMNDYICIEQIDTLLGFYYELNPKLRRILTYVYSKFYVQSPFHILNPDKMDEKTFNELEKVQNLNLIGKITLKALMEPLEGEKEITKEKMASVKRVFDLSSTPEKTDVQGSSKDTKGMEKRVESKFQTKQLSNDKDLNAPSLPVFETNTIEDNKKSTLLGRGNENKAKVVIATQEESNKKSNIKENKDTTTEEVKLIMNDFNKINKGKHFGLSRIFKGLEKFKSFYYNCLSEEYKNNIEFIFKFFEDTVLYPTTFAIYKVVYFSPAITAKCKYIIYKIVFLFLQCQKFLMEILREKLSENRSLIGLFDNHIDIKAINLAIIQQNMILKCFEKHLHLKDFSVFSNILETEENKTQQQNNNNNKDKQNDENLQTVNSIDEEKFQKEKRKQKLERIAKIKEEEKSIPEGELSANQKLVFYFEKIEKMLLDITSDVDKIGSKSYEHLNVIRVLESWYKYAIHFKVTTPYMNLEYFLNKMKMDNKDSGGNKEEEQQGSDNTHNLNNDLGEVNTADEGGKLGLNLDKLGKSMKELNVLLIGKRLLSGVRKTGVNFLNAIENILGIKDSDLEGKGKGIVGKLIRFVDDYDTKKAEFDENNALANLFMEENDPDIHEIKKSIAFDVLFKLIDEEFFKNSVSLYDENDTILLSIINKLFISDPTLFQDLIQNNAKIVKSCVFNYIQKQTIFLSQFVMIEFARADSAIEATMKQNLIEIFEFLRLFCENHHKVYQTFFITIKMFEKVSFLDFLFKLAISILKSLELFKDRKAFILFFKEHNNDYFEDIILKVFDLLIEMFQGCLPRNFDYIAENPNFTNFLEISYKYLDFLENEEAYEFYFAHFFRFINTFMEEITNSDKNKIALIKKFNPKKLMSIVSFGFKKFYFKTICKDSNSGLMNFDFKNEFVSYHAKLLEAFLDDLELKEDPLFILITGIFTFMRNSTLHKTAAVKINKILNNLEDNATSKTIKLTDKNRPVILLKKELFMFFTNLIKDVEISYKFKDTIEEFELNKFKEFFEESDFDFSLLSEDLKQEFTGVQKINYLVNIDSLFLDDEDIKYFLESAPYDDFNSKLNYFLDYYKKKINTIIEMRKILFSYNSKVLKFLYMLNYRNITIISVILSVVTNFLLFIGFRYSPQRVFHQVTTEEKLLGLHDWEETVLIKSFRYKEEAFIISLVHIILLALVLINYISFGYFKFFKSIEEDDSSEENNDEDIEGESKAKITFKDKVYEIVNILTNDEIKPILANFTFGLTAMLGGLDKFYFYSFQLFSIFSFFPTMQSVIISVRSRYKQFLSAALLICIMILFYSSISFFLFSEEYLNDYTNENVCDSLVHCFLYLFNYGVRSGSLGLPMKKINQDKYWSEFIFDWIFYFTLILILLNIINGIIVDTFQALREANNEKEYVKNNVCYICSIDKSKFEMKGVDYEYHLIKEHNILNYFHYVIKVLRTFEQDLNSMDYEVLKSIKQNSTEFFPVKKSLSLGN